MWPCIMVVAAAIAILTMFVCINNKKSIPLIVIMFFVGAKSMNIMVNIDSFFEPYLLSGNSVLHIFMNKLMSSGLNEELVKFSILIIFSLLTNVLITRYDVIMYSVVISIGMATLETIGYVLMNNDNQLEIALARIALCITGHCVYAIIMGYFYGLARISISKKKWLKGSTYLLLALIVPMFLHTTYNTIIEIIPRVDVIFIVGIIKCLIGSIIVCYTLKKQSANKNDRRVR